MRLLDRQDVPFAVALVASALVIFQRPLHVAMQAAREVEDRYAVDLIPGLAVLVGTYAFQQYRTRRLAKAEAAETAREIVLERRRSAELDRLVAFGRALGSTTEPAAVQQIFWRYLPAFARDRELWMLIRKSNGWEPAIPDALSSSMGGYRALEAAASAALCTPAQAGDQAMGLVIGEDICFPLIAGEQALGVIGVRNDPPLSSPERLALGAATAFLAITMRNVGLLEQLREHAVRDQLTGCFNRTYALEALRVELQRARRSGHPLSIMMFDVDRLKRVNDEHGHLAGDELLAAVGTQLGRTLRSSDVKCRWGGDEFLVILPETPLPGAEHAGAMLTREVSLLTIRSEQGDIVPTISVGVATAEPGDTDPLPLVARADAALYRAKHAGRNRFVVAAPRARAAS